MQMPLLTILVLASCAGPRDTSPPRAATEVASGLPRAEPAAQIAEYVVAAFEDSQGSLWFGTNGQGVARYDGNSLRYLSIGDGLVGDVVTDIAEDRAGRLWFGTQTGASRLDGTQFTNFGSAQGLPGAGCKLLVDRRGGVWAGTSEGAFRFDGQRFNAFELPTPSIEALSYKIVPGKVWELLEDSKGNIWFARDGYGACKYDASAASAKDGAAFTHFTKRDGLRSNNVADIAEDAQGNIWFGSITSDHPHYIEEGGLSRFDGRTITGFHATEGLDANDVYTVHADRAGNIWAGAVRVGAYRFDGKGLTLFDVTSRPDLTHVFGVQAIVEDRHGTLWFGFSGGLFRFDGRTFVNVTQDGPWTSP